MKIHRMIVLLLLTAIAPVLWNCGGGGARVQTTHTTMGQELQDLKKSFDEGIITQKEYERAKKDILKKYD